MEATIDRIARCLLEARAGGPLVRPEPTAALATAADAYAVQERVLQALGPVGAWKVGAAAPEAEPVRAPILAATIHASPASLPASAFHVIGIEAEIAYRLGMDLPVREPAYGPEEVAAAVEAMLPAIELVDGRLADHAAAPPLWKLADSQINGGLVTGPPATGWRRFDPLTQPVRLEVAEVGAATRRATRSVCWSGLPTAAARTAAVCAGARS